MQASLARGPRRAQDASGMKKRYRPNVAAILQRTDGRVLIGQRSDYPESWQFPQGGVDEGESLEEAVRREVLEETGVRPEAYRIVDRTGPHRYDFPAGPDRRGFAGQEQTYFLCAVHGAEPPPFDPESTCGEFLAVRWVDIGSFPVELAPPMKQTVYREVLGRLFGRG
jgi:putative (di)nucleoside polyphosphate hydrolase